MNIKKMKTKRKSRKKIPIHGDEGKILHLQSDVRDLRRELADMKVIIREHEKKIKIIGPMLAKLKLKIG